MRNLKYGSQVVWNYSQQLPGKRTIRPNSNNKKDVQNEIVKEHSSFISENYDFRSQKRDKVSRRGSGKKSGNGSETKRGLYVGLLFCCLFGFIFFLGIAISHASPVKESEYERTSLYENQATEALLENYLFEKKDRGEEDASIQVHIIPKIEFTRYRVVKNDTYAGIAARFGISEESIYLVNNIKKESILRAGEVLNIPNQDGRLVSVEKNDSIFKLADRYGVRWEQIVDANNLESAVIHPGSTLFIPGALMTDYEKSNFYIITYIWPVKGGITSYFGPRIDPFTGLWGFHSGIDIGKCTNMPVKVTAAGTVSYIGWSSIYGNYVIIKHKDNIISTYGHLKSVSVKKGQTLSQGAIIGIVGKTGRSTGPHLHFEIRKNGKLIDPLKMLDK